VNGFVQNTVFSPTLEGFRFLHFAHHSLAIFRKLHEFVQINVFSPRYAAIFSKVHECLPDRVFSLRSARFLIFALGAQPFCDFQQNERVCSKHGFQPDIRRSAIFALYTTVFSDFP